MPLPSYAQAMPKTLEEKKLLRLALKRYREDLQAQICNAEEALQDLGPKVPAVARRSLGWVRVPVTHLVSRSVSPEVPWSRWPATSVAPQSWSTARCNAGADAARSQSPGVSFAAKAGQGEPRKVIPRVHRAYSENKLQARKVLEIAIEDAESPEPEEPPEPAPEVVEKVAPPSPSFRSRKLQSPSHVRSPSHRSDDGRPKTPKTPQESSGKLLESLRDHHREGGSLVPPSERHANSRVSSPRDRKCQSRASSRAPSKEGSRAATPETPKRARESVATRLRLAYEAAKAAGLPNEDTVVAKADALLKCQENHRRALLQAMAQAADAFARARRAEDLPCLKQIKDDLSALPGDLPAARLLVPEIREVEALRRQVHNAIEDIKGHLRVFCRIRPLNEKEARSGDEEVVRVVDMMRLEVQQFGNYAFDGVFAPGSQEEVFEDCKGLVQSAIDGYNVTIFAYGQTGAGKTYTLYGTPEQEGIAGRSIGHLFQLLDALRPKHMVTVTASMVELYCGRLVDLLRPAQRRGGSSPTNSPKLNLRSCEQGGMQVENLTEQDAKDVPELRRLLNRGLAARTVACHAMNADSSRSHVMFTVKVTTTNRSTRESLTGKIVLCDLGGSERLKKSEVTGENMKEAIEINRSLTALGDVIEAIARGKAQVPYRNHRLTQLLQDSLGGSAKTLMFCNCSPARSNLHETMMSLNYALRAKRIVNNVAHPKKKELPPNRGSVSMPGLQQTV